MAGRHRAPGQSWWERQGYSRNHPVHGGTEVYERDYADEFEGSVEHAEGLAQRGGPVPITVNPTRTSNPSRPRTLAAGYDGKTDTMTVVFRDGAVYEYYDVTSMPRPGDSSTGCCPRRNTTASNSDDRVLPGATLGA
jgi:hypothetical protein